MSGYTTYGNISASYDWETGQVAVENLPRSVLFMAAAYDGAQMTWVSQATDAATVTVPETVTATQVMVFFLREDWTPAGPARGLIPQ